MLDRSFTNRRLFDTLLPALALLLGSFTFSSDTEAQCLRRAHRSCGSSKLVKSNCFPRLGSLLQRRCPAHCPPTCSVAHSAFAPTFTSEDPCSSPNQKICVACPTTIIYQDDDYDYYQAACFTYTFGPDGPECPAGLLPDVAIRFPRGTPGVECGAVPGSGTTCTCK